VFGQDIGDRAETWLSDARAGVLRFFVGVFLLAYQLHRSARHAVPLKQRRARIVVTRCWPFWPLWLTTSKGHFFRYGLYASSSWTFQSREGSQYSRRFPRLLPKRS